MRQAAASGSRTDRPATELLREQAREVTKDLQEMGGIAGDAVEDNLEHLRKNASEYYGHGRDGVHKVERSFEQFIRDQPLKSILIAGGVGLLLGRFWLRR
jgi:ElaB/YqjD/DUF883 family membrane-anchored ribosome-binding protein